ncbi:NAD-dependent protein deacetylase sirtuin-3, mitochondrial, variant 3 [Balamuthia mandrillaris]
MYISWEHLRLAFSAYRFNKCNIHLAFFHLIFLFCLQTGVYATLRKKYNLSDPRDLFTLSCFKEDPKPFYKLVGELFFPSSSDERGTSYRYEPTTVHRFLRLLHEKGVLLRVYTQNIDGLEEAAGLPRYAVVQAHGSFRTASCVACRKPYPQPERVLQLIQHQQRRWQVNLQPDSCSSCSASSSAAADKSTTACQELVIPTCEACSGFVKPDVVFFGEPLPAHVFTQSKADLSRCDLLIIIGTSLQVQPFSQLVGMVSESTPRLLLNQTQVHMEPSSLVERGVRSVDDLVFGERRPNHSTKRDVICLGDCQTLVKRFCELLGWGLPHTSG